MTIRPRVDHNRLVRQWSLGYARPDTINTVGAGSGPPNHHPTTTHKSTLERHVYQHHVGAGSGPPDPLSRRERARVREDKGLSESG